ncbi:uncharacterized protein PAE49_021036 [Odontesthes bonariensis]
MKDGNVSLILKNVTTNDSGTYECRVAQEGINDGKISGDPISTISLKVSPAGKEDGERDGGDEDGGEKDAGGEDGKKDGGGEDGKKDGGGEDGKKDGGGEDGKKDGGGEDGKKDGGGEDGKKDGGGEDGAGSLGLIVRLAVLFIVLGAVGDWIYKRHPCPPPAEEAAEPDVEMSPLRAAV